jgi:hypothetical protein
MSQEIIAGSGGAFASCGGKGPASGGHAFEAIDARLDDNIVLLPSLVIFDFDTRVWSSDSTVPTYSPPGAFNLASGPCVPELATDQFKRWTNSYHCTHPYTTGYYGLFR